MLNEPTLNQLRALRLDGMVQGLLDQATNTTAAALPFDERFSMLVQREIDWRDGRRLKRLLTAASSRSRVHASRTSTGEPPADLTADW